MKDNILKVLGVQSREDSISNTLAYGITKSTEIQDFFLSNICNVNTKYNTCKAYTRVSTGDTGIPDLVIVCDASDTAELIVIENKLKAEEGMDQTEKYASDDSIKTLHQKLCPHLPKENVNVKFIFITLFPDQRPSSSKFVTKKHGELLPLKEKLSVDKLPEQLLKDWFELVDSFYKNSIVDEKDILYEKLQDHDGLDGGYLYFRTFLSSLELPNGILNEGFFRDSRQGRRYYGAIFSKDSWHPAEMKENNGYWSIDPDKVFNIHFEPQFDVLNGIFNIYLHYEINPYQTASWAKENLPREQYAKYKDKREKFAKELKSEGLPKWVFGGGSNQIAKVQLDFQNHSAKDAIMEIESIIDKTSQAIDSVLEKL